LVKVTAHGLRFLDAALRMERCLQEFRIRGVKTNLPFLINLVKTPAFLEGQFTTRFLDETPELFQFPHRQDRATKVLTYIAELIVNGFPELRNRPWPVGNLQSVRRQPVPVPTIPLEMKARPGPDRPRPPLPPGTRDKFMELGPEKF